MIHGEHVSDFLTPEEMHAVELLRKQFNVDLTRTYQFHEALVAQLIDGDLTDHHCPWDIDKPTTSQPIRVEVKFSSEWPIKYPNGRLGGFRFASLQGRSDAGKGADVSVLSGIDNRDRLWAWVIPRSHLHATGRVNRSERRQTATILLPSNRLKGYRNSGPTAPRHWDECLVSYSDIPQAVVERAGGDLPRTNPTLF